MNSVAEMVEFVGLWDSVTQVTLSEEDDVISWRWTADGEYTSKSAYLAQFNGSINTFNATAIWKAQADRKSVV